MICCLFRHQEENHRNFTRHDGAKLMAIGIMECYPRKIEIFYDASCGRCGTHFTKKSTVPTWIDEFYQRDKATAMAERDSYWQTRENNIEKTRKCK